MSCVSLHYDPGSVYPVVDPLRVSGLLPHSYAYALAWDAVQIDVEDAPSLTHRQIMVGLVGSASVSRAKEIDFWNYFRSAPTLTLHIDGSIRGPVFGLMNKGCCDQGADTLLLKKAMAFDAMTGLYTLNSQDLFTFWGGKKVTFTWVRDDLGSRIWGEQTLDPVYPIVPFPDGTLVKEPSSPAIYVVFGGAKFWIPSPAAATALGMDLGTTLEIDPGQLYFRLPSAPVDFTLLRELNSSEVYVVFGRAKFRIPNPAGQVRIVPDGALRAIPAIPRDGTLLKEQNGSRVFLVRNGKFCWVRTTAVFNAMGLSMRRVRVVPDGALAVPLPTTGPNIGRLAQGDWMNAGDVLDPDRGIRSNDGRFMVVYQGDGNLVLYRNRDGRPLWASNTAGWPVGVCIMQSDGNLVIYDPVGCAIWSSHTAGNLGSGLVVQNDGNVVIYRPDGRPIWATNTVQP